MTTRNENAEQFRGVAGSPAVPLRAHKNGAGNPEAPTSANLKVATGASFCDYKFKNPSLLTLALTHSSLAYESNPEGPREPGTDNEQLEFIGDAVLGLVVAEAL